MIDAQKQILILNNIPLKAVYFLGIGGIGMSAVVRYLLSKNVQVSGYDLKETELTKQLSLEGATIHYEDNVNLINKDCDLVVYTPAIPSSHEEFNYFKNHNYKIVKRSDILGWITNDSYNICVAGSHGKTTVSTMISYLLRETNYGCNAFLGGISANYHNNFWSSENKVNVIEADEYDRSFHKLSPDVAIITAMDADHLEIYGTIENVEEAYLIFASKLKKDGLLLTKFGLKREKDFVAENHLTYHFNDSKADVFAKNIRVENGAYLFDVVYKNETLKNITLHMGGLHNIENVVAAVAVAKYLQIADEKIIDVWKNFKGVKRRFEFVLNKHKSDNVVLIDDYAHHPKELKALISGVKSLFNEKMLLVFQPHLYSRTKDLAKDFAESLDLADEVILLPIYPARELPIEGVSSELIAQQMHNKNVQILSKENFLKEIKNRKNNLIVMAGAGDIGDLVYEVKNIFQEK